MPATHPASHAEPRPARAAKAKSRGKQKAAGKAKGPASQNADQGAADSYTALNWQCHGAREPTVALGQHVAERPAQGVGDLDYAHGIRNAVIIGRVSSRKKR